MESYIASLTPEEKIVYELAKKYLKSSFSIEKSIGYIQFKKSKPS